MGSLERKTKVFIMVSVLAVISLAIIPSSSYCADAPTVTSITPSSGTRGQTLDITITGTNFSDVMSVHFGEASVYIKVNSFEVKSETEIKANISIHSLAPFGSKTVIVRTIAEKSEGADLFSVTGPPSIRSVIPGAGNQGATTKVTIIGQGFSGVTEVKFGDKITVNSFKLVDEDKGNSIRVTIEIDSDAAIGSRDVYVKTSGGEATGKNLFKVNEGKPGPPVMLSVSPHIVMKGKTLDITIKGRNFAGTPTVKFGTGSGITINGTPTRVSSTEIKANITISSSASPGPRNVAVSCGGVEAGGRGSFIVR